MELNGIQIERHGEGYAVTLRLWMGRREAPGEDVGEVFAAFEEKAKVAFDGEHVPDEATEVGEEDPTQESEKPAASARGRSRRRTSKSTSDTVAPSAESSAEEKPTEGRRRRRRVSSREASGGDENPTESSAGTAKSRQRRRTGSASTAESGSATKSPSEKKTYKDADLSRAASEAAVVIGPSGVMEVLQEFEVSKIGELKGDKRAEFVEALEARKEEE